MDEDLVWYYFDAKEEDETKSSKGPFSERDLDVLIRTSSINSGTLMFKHGYETWTTLFDIPELRTIIQEQSKEIFQLQSIKEKTLEGRKASLNDSPKKTLIKDVTLTPEKLILPNHENGDPPILDELVHFEAEIEEIQENPFDDEEKKDLLRKKLERNRKKTEKDKQKKRQLWYIPRINTNIYIKGLPEDITEEEMAEFFGKAGIIRINQRTLKPTIKIYRNDDGKCKGDGLVSYKMIESVQIALEVLDEKEIQPGYKLQVEQATFEQRGDYVARENKRLDKLQKDIAKQKENTLMGWDGDQEVENHGLKIVILQNMFFPDHEKSEEFYHELEQEVQNELQESVGEIQKLELFRDHIQGIIKVKFSSAYDADQCISIMNDRMFDERRIKCFYWDGKIDYKRDALKENHKDEETRLDEFGKWLEEGEMNHQRKIEEKNLKDKAVDTKSNQDI